jgi:hypothetical protein
MFVGSVGAVLGNIASLVLKYGVIWLALYTARYLIVLWVSAQPPFFCDCEQ